MNKLPVYKKKARRIASRKVKYEMAKVIPDIGWWRKFNEWLVMIINKAKV